MAKYNILVVPSDRTGVGYFRSTKPHIYLEKMYPDLFRVDIDYEPQFTVENIKRYDLVHYHRTLGDYDQLDNTLSVIENSGVPTVGDLDDYWDPGPNHPMHAMIVQHKIHEKIRNAVKVSRNIITTTPIFAEEMKTITKGNVYVIPNAVDPSEKQFKANPEKSERIRIGWLGGSSHLKDLELISNIAWKLSDDDLLSKTQMVLCGFDIRGTMTFIDENGEQQSRKIKPEETVWRKYEEFFTNNYKNISPDYYNFLKKWSNEDDTKFRDEPYRRVWTKPISTYATNYNLFDISLAPLVESKFNAMKSQLKVIEAGFHKKCLIAQNFGPYTIDLISARDKGGKHNPKGNALLVDSNRNHKKWYQHIKYLIQNPNLIEDIGESLFEYVNKHYHMDVATEKRKQIYEEIIKRG